MKSKEIILTVLMLTAIKTSLNYCFNVSYDGNDPYVSYETSWGKERFIKDDYIKYFKYYKKYVEKIPVMHPWAINFSMLSAPYNQLQQLLPFTGWGMYFNSEFITKIFQHNQIVNAIEIGSLYGLSTRHIASLLPAHGKLYAIDSWQYHDLMYEQFLSNIILTGLTDKIIPIKKCSDQAINKIKSYDEFFDLIYIDGDHETQGVLTDLELYYPLVKSSGVVCGDDWLLSTVRTAVEMFAQEHQLTIYAGCNFWFLRNEGNYHYQSLIDADENIWKFSS